jgi:TrmH family RNA methyltransferase
MLNIELGDGNRSAALRMQIDRAFADRLMVVLVATRNPLNIGAAARAMSNFGFQRLRVVNPYEIAFEDARSAVGASALLKNAERFRNVADAIADCSLVVGTTAARNRKLDHEVQSLQEGARILRRHVRSGGVAIVFGSEKRGLSNDDLSYCNWLLRIPTDEQHPSMNLGQAVAVCLYEVAKGGTIAVASQEREPAKSTTLGRLTEILSDALHSAGYSAHDAGALSEQKIRRLVRRLNLSEEDAEVWSGILRQMLWKMRSKS